MKELSLEMSKELESQLRLSEELRSLRKDAFELQELCSEELSELATAGSDFQAEEKALSELLQLAEVEEGEVQRLRRLMDFEEELGLPRIEMQEELVTLGSSEDPRCSLKVSWDLEGRLRLVEPHVECLAKKMAFLSDDHSESFLFPTSLCGVLAFSSVLTCPTHTSHTPTGPRACSHTCCWWHCWRTGSCWAEGVRTVVAWVPGRATFLICNQTVEFARVGDGAAIGICDHGMQFVSVEHTTGSG